MSFEMSREELIELNRRWFEEVWNQRRDETIDELMAEDAWIDGFDTKGERLVGREHFKEVRSEYLAMFPDIHVEIVRTAVDGDQVISWLSCTATACPKAFGLEGDPKRVTFSTVAWAHAEDGLLVGGRNLVDFGAIMTQLKPMFVEA
jgi:predicted ester cyclase